MATSKVNIFNSLPQHVSDSEGEDNARVQTRKTDKKEHKTTDNKKAQNKTGLKEDHGRTHEAPKQKGVSEQPHPLDRHSGAGNQAYGGKPKKGGAGKGNWGNYKDEKRVTEEPKEAGAEGTEEVAPVEEEKPTGITLQEYFEKNKVAQNEPQINEAKAKITAEQLKKELGTATLLKTRQQQEIDDKKVGKKKSTLDVNHHAAINTDNANLLNFRTGFVERELRVRTEDGVDQRRGPRTGGRRERENVKEEEPKEQATAQPTEEQKPAEGTTEAPATTEGKTEGKTEERRRDNGNRGQRGGRGGQHRGGNKPYGARKPQEAKINFEDESAFPKLG